MVELLRLIWEKGADDRRQARFRCSI